MPGWANERPLPSQLYTVAATSGEPKNGNVFVRINEGVSEGITFRDQAIHVSRTWRPGDVVHLELPMPVLLIEGHPSIEDTAGKLAVQRGPIVYAFEAVDNGGSLDGLALGRDAELEADFDSDLLGGMGRITGWATAYGPPRSQPRQVVAVPYFAWANRGAAEMAVWVPALE